MNSSAKKRLKRVNLRKKVESFEENKTRASVKLRETTVSSQNKEKKNMKSEIGIASIADGIKELNEISKIYDGKIKQQKIVIANLKKKKRSLKKEIHEKERILEINEKQVEKLTNERMKEKKKMAQKEFKRVTDHSTMQKKLVTIQAEIKEIMYQKDRNKVSYFSDLNDTEAVLNKIMEKRDELKKRKLDLMNMVNFMQKESINNQLWFQDNKIEQLIQNLDDKTMPRKLTEISAPRKLSRRNNSLYLPVNSKRSISRKSLKISKRKEKRKRTDSQNSVNTSIPRIVKIDLSQGNNENNNLKTVKDVLERSSRFNSFNGSGSFHSYGRERELNSLKRRYETCRNRFYVDEIHDEAEASFGKISEYEDGEEC